jgi:Tfp pilus assembly protein FimV
MASTLSAHSAYVVQPGDTLWSIAERLDPQADPRPVMNALARQVGGDTVRPGERLLLP